jgi:peptide/nickel transport system substrate-binding protein
MMEPSTAIAMLKTGEADISFITAAHLDEVVKNPNLKVTWDKYGIGLSIIYPDLRYPDKNSPWHDKRVRQAALYAINKDAISKDVLKEIYEPYGDIVTPYQPGYDSSVKPYPYDPIKAKALLSEAGYANGFDMTLTASVLENVLVQAVAADLRKVGIRANIEILDVGTFVSHIFGKKIKPGLYIDGTPFWAGERHPGLALGSTADPRVPFVYYIPKEITSAYEKLGKSTEIQDIEAKAKAVSRLFQEHLSRGGLFAKHRVWGIGPRVESWETVEGSIAITGLNYIKIKD